MRNPSHWSLGAKLTLVGAPFLLLALVSIALTLWVSWQLDGGAAAVNEAGRMRMQAYRMSLSAGTGDTPKLPQQVAEFERSIELLRHGDVERPLFVPWDDAVRARFAKVERDWAEFPQPLGPGAATAAAGLRSDTASLRRRHRCTGRRHRAPHVALDRVASPAAGRHDGLRGHRRASCWSTWATCSCWSRSAG